MITYERIVFPEDGQMFSGSRWEADLREMMVLAA